MLVALLIIFIAIGIAFMYVGIRICRNLWYAHLGERVLYKGKDIGAYVAGYIEDKYIILGFNDYTGCIQSSLLK